MKIWKKILDPHVWLKIKNLKPACLAKFFFKKKQIILKIQYIYKVPKSSPKTESNMFLDMIKSFVFDKYEIINDLLQHLQFHHVIYIKAN